MDNKPEDRVQTDPLIEAFNFDLKSTKQRQAFDNIYKKNNGDWTAVRSELESHEAFEPELIGNLDFTNQLVEWSGANPKVIAAFQKDEQIRSIRDIAAKLSKSAFIEKVKEAEPGQSEADQRAYAVKLHRELYRAQPTAMLTNLIRDTEVPILNNDVGSHLASVLESQPEFNIRTTSIYELVKQDEVMQAIPEDHRGAVILQMKTLQRIAAISPDSDALPVLYNANMHSSLHISSVPQKQFLAAMSQSGLEEETLMQIYTNAQQARVRNEKTIMALRETYQGTGVAMIDRGLSIRADGQKTDQSINSLEETLEKHHLSWDLLFADADFCDCGECTSVYSAAAYYVELLQYLRNNNLDNDPSNPIPINPDPKDISGTPLQKLLERRPDLGDLELTCQNSHTVLPYIDLVNEVMENYIAYTAPKPFNVEGETSGELLAEPQHTEYQAYATLKHEVYPFNLPYHQPIDAARVYLKHLDTSRYELMQTFRKHQEDADPELAWLKNEALDRAVDAESLGLTQEEYVILTKESFEQKALIDKQASKIHTEEEYRQIIGVKPVCEYYGYADNATMLAYDGLTLIKQQFLRRTGIDYLELFDLLKTRYVNPSMPTGKSKIIMESLRFSYRYLQSYAEASGLELMADMLVKSEQLAIIQSEASGVAITESEIVDWVIDQFAKVGKMIVIEIGRDGFDGLIFLDNFQVAVVEEGIIRDNIYYQIDRGSISVNTGEVTKSGKDPFFWEDPEDPDRISRMVFISNKGEKGVFLFKNNLLFLVMLEQRDSCDLSTALLQHLDGTPLETEEYDRLHRFIRLQRKLGWTINETDQAIAGLGGSPEEEIPTEWTATATFASNPAYPGSTLNIQTAVTAPKNETVIIDVEIFDLTGTRKVQQFYEYQSFQAGETKVYTVSWSIPTDLPTGEYILSTGIFNDGWTGQIEWFYDVARIHVSEGAEFVSQAKVTPSSIQTPAQAAEINPPLIHQLVAVKRLLAATGLELSKLLTFWSDMGVSGEKSLYQRLFLTHNVVGIDPIFKPDDNGDYLKSGARLSEHLPVVMAALHLTADDIQSIVQASGMEDVLTLHNVSILYRYRLLSSVLGLNIASFIKVLPLFGNLFLDAHLTLEFLERWGRIEAAGFTHQQLNFIVKGTDDVQKPLTPSRKNVLQLAKSLYDGLNAIDQAHQNLTAVAYELATNAFIRTKTSLLFDNGTVEQIIGLLEGTLTYTTNAPQDVEVTLADSSSLKRKLKYDSTTGSIQVAGILTEDEVSAYQAIHSGSDWASALIRIQKQQDKCFKELLSGIIDNETTLTEEEKVQIEATIKTGDISVAFEQLTEGQSDPNTAPRKRAAFLALFLPYLRNQLSRRFVIDTLADATGLDAKVTAALVTEVLQIEQGTSPIYDVFEQIKDSAAPSEAAWSGYLIPPADAAYTFIVRNSDASPVISLDGAVVGVTAQEDPTNEWWSGTLHLQAGKLYKLESAGTALNQINWKTPASAIVPIPSSALIPDFASQLCEPALTALTKAAILVTGFGLSADEVRFLAVHGDRFGQLDFNALSLPHWLRLDAYVRLRDSLPLGKGTLLEFWAWVYTASDWSQLPDRIAELTGWSSLRIGKLIAADHYNANALELFGHEKTLLKLQHSLQVADQIGVDIDLLFEWAVTTSDFGQCRVIADNIKHAIRARHAQTEWEQIAKPLHDQLRSHQREAMIGYLLQRQELIDWEVTDADGLFEYFLIDVQMEPVMETSRIKQAISSVQLFVQRCFLGLEEKQSGISPAILDRERWDWMQRYRVWEANRKVFLYPENWIESNLRDDKSPFFKELESDLLQKDITKENATAALASYLYKVDEVANMEMIGLCKSGTGAETQWSKGARLHIFARTRNAPYYFYYRYFALDEQNWYAWEKMQVDIPCYDSEDHATRQVTGNGCYLTPIVWHDRLFAFFPQIMKKTKANPGSGTGSISSFGNDVNGIDKMKPIEFYEIRMAWSEYRGGKWTQKQISKEAVYSDPIDAINDLPYFKFVPINYSDRIVINVDDNLDSDGIHKAAFSFNGSVFKVVSPVTTVEIPIDKFNRSQGRLHSWEVSSTNPFTQVSNIYFREDTFGERLFGLKYDSIPFHYLDTGRMLGKLGQGTAELFRQQSFDPGELYMDYYYYTSRVFHELKSIYSLYGWELFFHAPMLLGDALSKAQQYEEAMKWFHYVFNPIADGNDDNRFWQFTPFKNTDSQRILDRIFKELHPNTPDPSISEWRNKPFMPHVVARSRGVAYMKWVVMKYLDNLLAWGDHLFRQDTIESINQATQLYVLAGHILGPRPMTIPKRGSMKVHSYLSLLDKWDAFGNAMVEMELAAPFSDQMDAPSGEINGELTFANIYGLASSSYFCIPNNPKLTGYWDKVADRLYKIRHGQNMDGVFRSLALFEPPIDPALLVRAAAQGLSIATVLNDLNTVMPNYRFYYLLQKALELCNELKSLGGAMLAAMEKQDNEAIALIRAKHEGVMQHLQMEIRKKQLEEAQQAIETLEQNRKAVEARMKYYLKLSGLEESLVPSDTAEFNGIPNEIVTVAGDSGLKLIPYEKEDMDKASAAADWQTGIGVVETLASVLHAFPSTTIDFKPLGVGAGVAWGFPNLANAASAVGRGLRIHADHLSYQSASAGKKAGFTRALQERIFQANSAGYELKQIDKQITSQQIRIQLANQEIANQQQAIDNAAEVEAFIRSKYTNEELYVWMKGSLKTLYRQVYNLAYDLAKKAEKTYCFERGVSSSNWIQAGYFDAGRDGLLAGEQLYVGLKQLEAAYQNERGYDYEISKSISLYQLDPLTIVKLRETGTCEFALPEVLFDLDYPGHYKRRIKSLSISIPCVAGPYTSVNASLRLLENKFRNTAIGGKAYEENTEENDDRFSSYIIPIQAIAASTAQNDDGMFELNFKDERYLPFEGAGVISKWRLELPAFKQFDYRTISDVIIHLNYTANDGGERLKSTAAKSVKSQLAAIEQQWNETGLHAGLNMKHDLPNEWHLLKKKGTVDVTIDKSRLPFMAQPMTTAIESVIFLAKGKSDPATFTLLLGDESVTLKRVEDWKLCRELRQDITLNEPFTLKVDDAALNDLEELIMIVKYHL